MIFESTSDNDYLLDKLRLLAEQESTPFCYHCYLKAPSGTCSRCGSDDLMRITDDNGPEYGFDWIVSDLIEKSMDAVDTKDFITEFLDELYPKVVIGNLSFSTSEVLKTCDPLSYEILQNEELSYRVDDGEMILINGNYFWTREVETYIDNNLLN